MALELYFTSAERGLQPGSRGYCTVARTARMSRGLLARLEEISAYRPLFAVHDARADDNPVVVSHVRVTADGQPFNILSRIASAAPDYSGRSNYLAHHVVISPDERAPGGPVWLAQQPGVLARSWDGEVRELAAARSLPRGNVTPGICHAWERMTRDAGWAGVLAEHLATKPTQPFYLIYEPGQDILPLLAEVLALLPASRRWDVTFSTYYTGARGNMSCAVRGVVRGSEEATLARASAHLDLANLGSRTPPESQWVDAARTGQSLAVAATPAFSGAPRALRGGGGAGPEPPDIRERARESAQRAGFPGPRDLDFPDEARVGSPRDSGKKWLWITGGIAAALLIIGGLIVLVLNLDAIRGGMKKDGPEPVAESAQKDEKGNNKKDVAQGDSPPADLSKGRGSAQPGGNEAPPPKAGDSKPPNTPGIGAAGMSIEPKDEPKVKSKGAATPDEAATNGKKAKELEKQLVDMTKNFNAEKEAKEKAVKEAGDAQAKQKAAEDEANRFRAAAKASIRAQQHRTIKLPLTDNNFEAAEFSDVLIPTDMYLVRKTDGVAEKPLIANKYHVTWDWPRTLPTEFVINAQIRKGATEAEHYFRIRFDKKPIPVAPDSKKGTTPKNVTVIKVFSPDASKEKEERQAFIAYLKDYQLVVIEAKRLEIGAKPFERAPRITVFDFE